jgi:hypothetical protein
MRYINHSQFDPRYIIDTHRTFEQAVGRHRTLLTSLGTPITVFHREGDKHLNVNGTFNEPVKCYCTNDVGGKIKNPDPDHGLCYGTGVFPGYERFGYSSLIIANPTPNLVLTNTMSNLNAQNRTAGFILAGVSSTGTVETPDYPVTDFKAVTYFRIREAVNLEENRNEYFFSTDSGATYTQIPINYSTQQPVPDLSVFPTTMTQIRFRVILKKRAATSSTPVFTYLKFRYRNQYFLSEVDDRFKEITLPATLASYSISPQVMKQWDSGLTIDQDPIWWTLPDSKIKNGDVLLYLLGHNQGKMYIARETEVRTYGKYALPLSITFKVKLIQSEGDAMGITKYLVEDTELRNVHLFETFNSDVYFPSEKDYSDINYKNHQPGSLTTW